MIGMLWFDNSPKTLLSVKVQKAADYYEKKYGKLPDLCYVNPSMLDESVEMGNITIRPYRPVLPGHLWIGVDDETTSQMGMVVEEESATLGLERIKHEEVQESSTLFQNEEGKIPD